MKTKYLLAGALGALLASSAAHALDAKPYFIDKSYWGPTIRPATDVSLDMNGLTAPIINSASPVFIQWEGISQYDGARFARNFIPPDTIGAVGMTQYFEATNGAYAIYNKSTGALQSMVSDVAWWASVGKTGANGDTRVMYNADAKRWIVMSFAASVANLQIAISDTDDAMGGWKTTQFTGFAGGTADYPTLALDKNAVYIGTNNFNASGNFRGTTLNVIPIDSLFNNSTPTVTNMKQFTTAYPATTIDKGFAQQGVNSSSAGSTGHVVAASLFWEDNVAFDVNGLTSSDATGATVPAGDATYLNMDPFVFAGNARQPNPLPAPIGSIYARTVTTGDERISSSAYEVGGRIYMVNTVNSDGDGLDYAQVRYTIIDANTKAIIDQGNIGDATHDYWEGAIAVNALGQVVITYNRSGSETTDANGDGLADGNISVMAQVFKTSAAGKLVKVGSEMLLKVSPTSTYHNGSVDGAPPAGRQRWGDYAQVSVDPGTNHGFYLIGEFAREPNNAANGHPGGTGGTRWGTWIAGLNVGSVPEPASWAMMITGFGFIGGAMRRQRKSVATA
nr:PEPxxWA-CTERM sorting domain-containing protein [Polymorphobacter arshaanensis]